MIEFNNQNPNVVGDSQKALMNQKLTEKPKTKPGAFNASFPALASKGIFEKNASFVLKGTYAKGSGNDASYIILGGSTLMRSYVAEWMAVNRATVPAHTETLAEKKISGVVNTDAQSVMFTANIAVAGTVINPIYEAIAFESNHAAGFQENPDLPTLQGTDAYNQYTQSLNDSQIIGADRCIVLCLLDGTNKVNIRPETLNDGVKI